MHLLLGPIHGIFSSITILAIFEGITVQFIGPLNLRGIYPAEGKRISVYQLKPISNKGGKDSGANWSGRLA